MANKSRGSGSGINLSKPSELSRGAIDLGKKDEQPAAGDRGLSVGVERQLGTIGGFDVEAEVSADIARLLPGGRLDLGVTKSDEGITEIQAGIGGRIVSPIGGFGIGTSGKLSINPDTGTIEIEAITGRVEAGGVSVEVATDPKTGKTSAEVCYTFGIISSCISIQPDEDDKKQIPIPTPTPNPPIPGGQPIIPNSPELCKKAFATWKRETYFKRNYSNMLLVPSRETTTYNDILKRQNPSLDTSDEALAQSRGIDISNCRADYQIDVRPTRYYIDSANSTIEVFGSNIQYANYCYIISGWYDIINPEGFRIAFNVNVGQRETYYAKDSTSSEWKLLSDTRYYLVCGMSVPINISTPPLPNPPQRSHMNDECCKKIDKMYKILGIEKFERNKFDVANTFLVAGGQGNMRCTDLYELFQALFRMLANGLIINPKCAPGGMPWESANASAWAGQMYEMQAESMSDGNQSQKVEVGMMMAMAQQSMMLAEIAEKVKFLIDAIGLQPEPKPSKITIPFTIHEEHQQFKGFDPRKKGSPPTLKQIDTQAATATDESTEKTISKMLFPSEIPIISWTFKPDHISIIEALRGD